MAQRRMFSKSITNSSQFLMMPVSSQNLYFHLGMNADDDGFCEHFALMRMTDSKPDDLKILNAKGFVTVFDDKVLIITDWKENNYLRSDRYTPSKYLDIYKDEIERLPFGIPKVDKLATQVRLGKDRIGNKTTVIKTKKPEPYSDERFTFFWNEYPNKVGKGKAWESWIKLQPSNELARKIVQAVRKYKTTTSWKKDNGQFIPHASTFLNQRRFDDDIENITSGSVTEF